jgi:N-carbamoylputrescine amidase
MSSEQRRKSLQIALIQHQCNSDREANIESLLSLVQTAAGNGAELILLPELHDTLYFCQQASAEFFDWAEPMDGPTVKRLSQWAKQFECVLVGSIFEKRQKGLYHNTAVVLETDGSLAGCYRKMHIPDDPGYYEKYYFTPGDQGFKPVETSVGKLGVMVCWDQWFPEAARLMSLAGADLLLYPTAIGWAPDDDDAEKTRQLQAWQTIQKSHSIANEVPVLVANRCGFEEDPGKQTAGIDFWGNSFCTDCFGQSLASAGTQSTVVEASLDLTESETVRQVWPFLRDRRIDAYNDLLKRSSD